MQADWQTTLLNYTTGREKRLANIPKAQKTYPASGAVAMLPLTGAFRFVVEWRSRFDDFRTQSRTTLRRRSSSAEEWLPSVTSTFSLFCSRAISR